jgi:hypothetical protein
MVAPEELNTRVSATLARWDVQLEALVDIGFEGRGLIMKAVHRAKSYHPDTIKVLPKWKREVRILQ